MAKKVQLKDNSGNKAYPVTSSACVGMSDGSGSLDSHINKITTEYNVSLFHPTDGVDGGNKYTLETAIAKVPAGLRNVGIKCSFLDEAGLLDTWEYQGGTFTNVSSWNQVGAKKFLELTVAPVSNRAYSDVGKNLFNKDAVNKGYYIYQSGTEMVNSSYNISDYILVEPNTQYTKKVNDGNAYTAFYDENLNLLGTVNTATFTTPENTRYVRISQSNTSLEKQQLEKGNTSTNYMPYTANAVQQRRIVKLEAEKLTINPGKNLFNKDAVNKGYYINNSGILVENDLYFVSDYIPFNGQNLIISGKSTDSNMYIEFLDENLNQLKVQAGNILTCEFSDGYAYMRFSEGIANIDRNIQVEYGTEATAYEPYTPFVSINEQAKQYVQNEVSKNKALFILKEMGKNLLDPAAIQPDVWISDKNGTISEMGYGFCVSGLIQISDGQSLTASVGSGNFDQCRAMLYDKDLNILFVSEEGAGTTHTISYVEGAAYAVFTFRNKDVVSIRAQVEYGTEATAYEPYTPKQDWQELLDQIPGLVEKTNTMLTLEPYINLFNKETTEDGKYLYKNGTLFSSSFYYASDYIPAKPNTNYVGRFAGGNQGGATGWCFYDENKIFISSYNVHGYCTTPENTAYIRVSGTIANKDDAMIVEGTEVPSTYYPYQLTVPIEYLPSNITNVNQKPELVLPSKMYFLKDKAFILYYDNIFLKPHKRNLQTIMTANSLGTSRDTVFAGTPTITDTGSITVQQVLENLEQANDSLEFEILDPTTKSGQTINVLCVGDSFTDIGTWVNEVYQQLTDNGMTCNLIGTSRGGNSQNDNYRHEGLSGGTLNGFLLTNAGAGVIVDVTGLTEVINTTYGGTTYQDENGVTWNARGYKVDSSGIGKLMLGISKTVSDTYEETTNFPASGNLTKITGDGPETLAYTNKREAYFNPFWNPTKKELDFSYYIDLWGYNNPDLLILQFTWNDLGLWTTSSNITTFINGIKTVIDTFHAEYPSAKVIFSIEPQGSMLPSGFDIDGKNYTVLNFAKKLLETFEDNSSYNTWFRISPSYAGVDRINGYGSQEVVLSSRYPDIKTKVASGDTTHCNSQGMRQIGDMVVPVIYSLI